MLDRTERKLDSLYGNEPQRGLDGQLHEIDTVTRVNRRQCDRMAELHEQLRPDLSIETGLAYGFSTLPMLDAMERHGYGHHIAIDPTHARRWHGIAVTAAEELGFSPRFTWLCERSDQAFARMIAEGKRAQFIFLDGEHYFETILTDFTLADQMLDVGGMLIVNNMWMPTVRAVASYLVKNMPHYERTQEPHENIFVIRKARKNARPWDHFISFDGAGLRETGKRSPIDRLLRRQA